MDEYLKVLLEEVELAEKENEIPISAIIVKDGKIISRSHNSRISSTCVLDHAEVKAIIDAEKSLGDWRLNGCDLYVTLEPCKMCTSIIREARIDNVYYFIKRSENKVQFYKTNICSINDESTSFYVEKFKSKMSDFFKLSGKR